MADTYIPNPGVVVTRQFNGTDIAQRADGYLNATAMCKANGKEWSNYRQNATTEAFLSELEGSLGIPRGLLVVSTTTGPNNQRGTYVHPLVASNLGQWLSPAFAVQVAIWVDDIRTKGYATAPGVEIDMDRMMQSLAAISNAMPVMAAMTDKLAATVLDVQSLKSEVAELRSVRDPRFSVSDRMTTYEVADELGIKKKGRGMTIPNLRKSLIAFLAHKQLELVHRRDTRRNEETFPVSMVSEWKRLVWAPKQAEAAARQRDAASGQGGLFSVKGGKS